MPIQMNPAAGVGDSISEDKAGGRADQLRTLASRLAVGTPLDWAIGLLVLMTPVSLWAAFDVRFSLPKAIGLLLGVGAFYVTVAYIDDVRHLIHALVLYFSIGTSVAALALVGTRWLYKTPLLSDIVRFLPQWVRGLPGAIEGFHPNEVAGVLLWFVPAQIALLVWSWQQGRLKTWEGLASFFSTAVTTFTLILTQSRGGWLGLAVGLALMGAWVDRRVRIGVLLLSVALLAMVGIRGPDWVGTVLFGPATSEVLGTLRWEFRVKVWRVALWGIRDFAFTGMGLGTFRRVVRLLYPLDIPLTYDIAHAHNGFLQAGVDFGVAGLVAYTSIWSSAAWLVISSLRRARGWLRALTLGLGGSLASYFVYNLLDTVALGAKPGPAWWMMLGLIVGVFRLATDYPKE